jgi:hypothetical protein
LGYSSIIAMWLKKTVGIATIFDEIANGVVSQFQNDVLIQNGFFICFKPSILAQFDETNHLSFVALK